MLGPPLVSPRYRAVTRNCFHQGPLLVLLLNPGIWTTSYTPQLSPVNILCLYSTFISTGWWQNLKSRCNQEGQLQMKMVLVVCAVSCSKEWNVGSLIASEMFSGWVSGPHLSDGPSAVHLRWCGGGVASTAAATTTTTAEQLLPPCYKAIQWPHLSCSSSSSHLCVPSILWLKVELYSKD